MNGGLLPRLQAGALVGGGRPALAEAEVEYHDHVSNTIYVAFPVRTSADPSSAALGRR
jgi:isoleucyl-tRNA synthetase